MHGSKHWLPMQARFSEQSVSCWHSPLCTKSSKIRCFSRLQKLIKLTGNTAAVRISCKTRRALANCSMAVHCAFCIRTTWVVLGTWINTASVSTSLSESTLIVRGAANLNWSSLNQSNLLLFYASYFKTIGLLILVQLTTPLPVYPSKQTQLMVLVGVVEWTLQTALATQGAMVEQGSTQRFLPPDW